MKVTGERNMDNIDKILHTHEKNKHKMTDMMRYIV